MTTTKPKDDWTRLSGQQRKTFTLRLTEIYGWECGICRMPITRAEDLTCEHVKPRSQGGLTTIENCRPAHATCNYAAGAAHRSEVIEHDGLWFFLGQPDPNAKETSK